MRSYSASTFAAIRLMLLVACVGLMSFMVSPSPTFGDDPPPVQGDFDNDGVDDDVVAEPSPSNDEPGRVEIVSGDSGETLGTIYGGESGDQFGYSVSAGCDVNRDGVRDLIAGAPKEADGDGRAYIFHGPIQDEEVLTPEDAELTLQSPDQDTYDFGKRVECLEDLDNDGKPDVLVEASYLDQSQNAKTRTYIFNGLTGALIETLEDAQGGQIPVWNVQDLLMVIGAWGTPNGDLTGDELTNILDLLYVINHWGQDKFPFYVNPPITPSTIPLTNGYLIVNNISDGVRFDTAIVGQQYGVLSDNGMTSTRIHTRGFKSTQTQQNGLYGAPVVDHFHELIELRQASGVNQALVRVGGGDRFLLHMATLDSTLAENDSCRFYGVSNAAIVHSKIKGGIYRIGVPHNDEVHAGGVLNCNQWPQNLIDHWVMNVQFDYGQVQPGGQDYPAAFAIGYHVHKVVFDNVRVTTPGGGGRFVDIDGISPCTPTDPHPIVEIRCCTFNGNPVTLLNCSGDLTNVTIIPCQ